MPLFDVGYEHLCHSHAVDAGRRPSATALAAYLTTLSNNSSVKQSGPWKRFVHVGTDDLESERVERAVKRVRSDLGGQSNITYPHTDSVDVGAVSSPAEWLDSSFPSSTFDKDGDFLTFEDPLTHLKMLDNLNSESEFRAHCLNKTLYVHTALTDEAEPFESNDSVFQSNSKSGELLANGHMGEVPGLRSVSTHATHVPNVASHIDPQVEPLPTELISQVSGLQPPIANSDHAESTQGNLIQECAPSPNVVEGSSNTVGIVDDVELTKKASSRKVVINDFEIIRVLGKGCAGKVFLVRHKKSSNLYALKAITKRHVLAHQELQHTLTEQAVLKRMAREAKDPFVVKLWWSFHDKENLFLVMV